MSAAVCGFTRRFPGLVPPGPYNQPFRIQRHKEGKFNDGYAIQLPKMIPRGQIQYFPSKHSRNKHVLSIGRDDYQLNYNDDLPQEPFLLTLIKEAIWATKSLFLFLVEQPSQLKYIEWPSFQSTLKTATLTLVIVALLIVALSSVDSILCYLLALLLRRSA
ncbi:hypothetical protein JCGZ_13078 [Jatropha curcas]|uniref:Protein translocase subunit SecE n=1 Tax=Jatropha curcas TaxID=180498 RepID=A0A067KAQ1_JATCU|nr:uncharacterized protein LOC105638510 [Jatropha curcas]KDP33291.1 hypothetical protein JCGZ_13078 [Jatropha curcas]